MIIGYRTDYILENGLDKIAYGFIYITTNLINGKKYIGQKKFDSKWKDYLGSGKLFKIALKLYGKINFSREIICLSDSQSESDILEIYYIDLYEAVESKNYYNIADGGKGGNKLAGKSDEELIEINNKRSKAMSGRILSDETKHKMSDYRTGLKYSDEHRKNIGMSKSGAKHPLYGTHRSDEDKRKISKNHSRPMLGRQHSEETRRRMSQSHMSRGQNNPNLKNLFICINTKEMFNSVLEASKAYNVLPSGIYSCCRGYRKHAGRHPITNERLSWMRYNDYVNKYGINEIDNLKINSNKAVDI